MKTIRTYSNPGEAGFGQSLLESAGIEAALEHEASASTLPLGSVRFQLQVPDDRAAEAELLLADRPVSFTRTDDEPKFGFWKGGVAALLLFSGELFVITITGGSWHVNGSAFLIIFICGGLIGANLPALRSKRES